MTDAISAIAYGQTRQIDPNEVGAPLAATFVRAVVLQTLNDPSLRDSVVDAQIISTLRNKEQYLRAPRNSLVCRITAERKGLVQNDDVVCYPFFSSHVMLPVKPGEQVWLFLELPDRPYWMSRISEPLHVEDVNFTHGDRRINRDFKGNNDGKTGKPFDDGSGNFDTPRKLKYQNGDPSKPEIQTLSGDQKTFQTIITGAKESKFAPIEPVPRATKRPGDLVIQGSNNTIIRLGTEMGWTIDAAGRPGQASNHSQASMLPEGKQKLDSGLGAIDIVTGRGRYFQSSANEKDSTGKKSGNGTPNSTRPYIVETIVDGNFETDKNVSTQQDESTSKSKGNFKSNAQEGDPDFLMDASRIYASTFSEIDKNLGTGPAGVAKHFETPIIDKMGATVALKSDHIRIVARKSQLPSRKSIEPNDAGNENPSANGTIRIVKEGEPGKDLASITIEADGTIHISGSKIFIGRTKDDGGEGSGPGPGESQPYVKYKQLEDLLTKTYDDLTSFFQKLQLNFRTNTTPGFGGPNPALVKSSADECELILKAIGDRKKEIQKLKSKRIFGE
jgi:hypothetical protein